MRRGVFPCLSLLGAAIRVYVSQSALLELRFFFLLEQSLWHFGCAFGYVFYTCFALFRYSNFHIICMLFCRRLLFVYRAHSMGIFLHSSSSFHYSSYILLSRSPSKKLYSLASDSCLLLEDMQSSGVWLLKIWTLAISLRILLLFHQILLQK